jgi:hypothetical protein
MAAGFKKATVRAADVPATQTNFPTYVDLERLGITTLAEAQSVRVYADSGKTTEWAREIVSVTEMHVKVPSLTSTVSMFVDWDGVRADYAVGATYGRNAVWSNGFGGVWHMGAGVLEDSTGQVMNSTTNEGTAVVGKLGNATDYNGSQRTIIPNAASINISNELTYSMWTNADSFGRALEKSDAFFFLNYDGTGSLGPLVKPGNVVADIGSLSTGVWYNLVGRFSATDETLDAIRDGVVIGTTSFAGPLESPGLDLFIGSDDGSSRYDGRIDEVRISSVKRSIQWLALEHTNQNDESTFWGTWTDVSTATTVTNIISIGNIVELNNISSIIGA